MGMFTYGVACALDNPSLEAPITLRGDIEYLAKTAKDIGYEAIELQLKDPQNFDWNNLKKVADQAGLSYAAIATGREYGENGLCLTSNDAGVRRAAVDKLKQHIDLASVLGCMVIVGTVRGKIADFSKYDHYLGMLTEAKLELADYAAKKDVIILVENILSGISNYLNTMRQVMDYVVRLNHPNILVHLDTYSMLMEDNDIQGAVEYCASKLEYVHFSDSARLFPGGGNVDFNAHMKALKKVGYHGYVVTECVPLPDPEACARYGLEYMRAMEECVRIETAFTR